MIANFGRTLKLLILLLLSLSCKSFATIYYVNISNSTPGSGLTWGTAFNDLNQALAVYSSGDQIWVAKGTYYPTTTTDRTATFSITNYLSLYGGFNGTETAATMANPTANPTILSGDIGVVGNAADNSYHVVTFTSSAGSGLTMDGFTITGGNANQGYPASTTPAAANTGGGFLELSVNNQMQSATISHCIFTANFAVYGGGFGAYGDGNSSGTAYGIVYCTFTNNTAFVGGGVASLGYNNDYSVSGIDMCVFISNNSTNNQGSAIATTFTNGPAGVMLTTVTNCVLYNNPQPQLYNLATNGSGSLQLYTSIIWSSGAPYTGPLSAGNSLIIDMCDVDLATPDGSNLDLDPQFTNPAAGDFHTPHCGPLVDQGFTTAAFNIGHTDPDGNPRLLGPKTDIGLYESQIPPAPPAPNVTYCQNAVALPLTATGTNLLWYTTIGGTGNALAPTPVTSGIGATEYYVTQTPAGSCESTPTTVTVTINPGATAPTATPNITYCQNAVALPLTATGTNLLWYTTIGGTGNALAPTPVTSGTGSTEYYVTQTPAGSCESPPTTVTVNVNPTPSAEFTWSTPCEGKATLINAVSTTADQYTWDFGNEASVTGSGAGPYEVTWATSNTYTVALIITAGGCQGQTQHLITVNPNPNVGIAAITVPLCQGNNISLEASGASSYQWSPATGLSNAGIFNPIALLQSDIQYTVTGTDDNGCSATAQVTLEISSDCSAYYIPNAFTPNGDGKNDEFRVITADVPRSFTLIVFNRFGGKVFESANIGDGWNGSIGGNPASTGTYVYVMQATTSAGAIVKKQGTIILIR